MTPVASFSRRPEGADFAERQWLQGEINGRSCCGSMIRDSAKSADICRDGEATTSVARDALHCDHGVTGQGERKFRAMRPVRVQTLNTYDRLRPIHLSGGR